MHQSRSLTAPSGSRRREFLKGAAAAGVSAGVGAGPLTGSASARVTAPRRGGSSALPGEAGLGGNIGKSLFYTINVSDLDRAVAFYEANYPVTAAEVMNGPARPSRGWGYVAGSSRRR